MLAWRTTWIVKPRRMAEAVALLTKMNAEIQGVPSGGVVRMYTSKLGPSDTLVFEEVWPSIDAHAAWWAVLGASPEMAAFSDAWDRVMERSTSTELWNVTEWKW